MPGGATPERMTGPRRAVVVLAAALLTTACPAPADRSSDPTPPPTRALPGLPTNASTGLPEYEGPPADAPPSAGPLTTVRAAVDLTPATPGFARSVGVVAARAGGAHVVLDPLDPELPQQLVTVGADLAIAGAVPIPPVSDAWGMHELDDGSVVITGRLPQGPGFAVVDPATGAARTAVVAPSEAGPVDGASALAGSTLYLFITRSTPSGLVEQLVAADVGAGTVLARHGLHGDVRAASVVPVGGQFGGLVPRPEGGVVLVFDASPTDVLESRIPTLLSYDAQLRLTGEPVRVTDLAEGAETQAVAAGVDGTVFLLVEVTDGGWIVAVPDGGGAGPVLAQLEDRIYDYAMTVEPAQVWALLPAAEGAQAVDLTTGEIRGPLRLDCEPRLDVRDIVPAPDGALLIGECDTPREDTQMLWFVGPDAAR